MATTVKVSAFAGGVLNFEEFAEGVHEEQKESA